MHGNRQIVLFNVVVVAIVALLVGCSSLMSSRGSLDGFEGSVSGVWEDGLRLDVDDGRLLVVDTWDVCGDNTARNINTGDRITVYANRDILSYEAWRILDANGQPLCETTTSSETQQDTAQSQSNTYGGFQGTVSRVWEDGLRLDLGNGESLRIDTWEVCGDNTARNIRVGDQITVFADRDFFSYEAWRILDANGEPVCGGIARR